MTTNENISIFYKNSHLEYLLNALENENRKMVGMDNSKMMLLYFVISGLDILDGLKNVKIPTQTIIDWIYSQQCFTNEYGGFKGGPFLGFPFHKSELLLEISSNNYLDQGHLVLTYSALLSLKILGDDFSRVRKEKLLGYLKKCQKEDGSFQATIDSLEADLRFLYSAAVISFLLGDFSAINIEKALKFIFNCQNNDGAFGLRPFEESHSGATYCALASLVLFKKIDEIPNKTKLIEFLVNRQVPWEPSREKGCIGGFQGRINKYPDSCYSFWNGASLKILGFESFINKESVKPYILNCQNTQTGGFKKYDYIKNPDPIHTLHSLYGLSILQCEDLPAINPVFGTIKKHFNEFI